jgi:hypothetical protein
MSATCGGISGGFGDDGAFVSLVADFVGDSGLVSSRFSEAGGEPALLMMPIITRNSQPPTTQYIQL